MNNNATKKNNLYLGLLVGASSLMALKGVALIKTLGKAGILIAAIWCIVLIINEIKGSKKKPDIEEGKEE